MMHECGRALFLPVCPRLRPRACVCFSTLFVVICDDKLDSIAHTFAHDGNGFWTVCHLRYNINASISTHQVTQACVTCFLLCPVQYCWLRNDFLYIYPCHECEQMKDEMWKHADHCRRRTKCVKMYVTVACMWCRFFFLHRGSSVWMKCQNMSRIYCKQQWPVRIRLVNIRAVHVIALQIVGVNITVVNMTSVKIIALHITAACIRTVTMTWVNWTSVNMNSKAEKIRKRK